MRPGRTQVWLAPWLAWSPAVLIGMGIALTWFFAWRDGDLFDPRSMYGPGQFIPIGYAVAGLVVASRRPRNPVGWLMLAAALASTLQSAPGEYAIYHLGSSSRVVPSVQWAAWTANWALVLVFPAGAMLFLLLLFPDGRLLSRRWRVVAILAAALDLLTLAATWLDPTPILLQAGLPRVPNPIGVHGFPLHAASPIGAVVWVAELVLLASAAASVVLRYRRARGDERAQLKWFSFAVGTTLGGLLVLSPWSGSSGTGHILWTVVLMAGVGVATPAAVAVAILRYRLYEIDRLISRTLAYALATALLAGLYLGLVLGISMVSPLHTGSPATVAISTLAVAAMFRPLLMRVRSAVDRRFNRARYDAARTLEAFSERLRNEVDIGSLAGDLRTVVGETMQPRSVSLWLRGETA